MRYFEIMVKLNANRHFIYYINQIHIVFTDLLDNNRNFTFDGSILETGIAPCLSKTKDTPLRDDLINCSTIESIRKLHLCI